MTWNTGNSILGTGGARGDVYREADVIFTALFIGATHFQNRKNKESLWRVDMEPNTDEDKALGERTAEDRKSMKSLNDCCSKVNHILWNWLGRKEGGLEWGLTPTFARGGMISAGRGAADEYAHINPEYAQTAYRYLTAPRRAAWGDQRQNEMYIGRGAYCGMVMDDEGNVVNALSTIRTLLDETTPGVGDRWRPPTGADIRMAQYKGEFESAAWGIIGSNKVLEESRQQGMRFYPRQSNGEPVTPDVAKNIVGYTHGMIRAIYETKRMGQGTAFEMSIGTATYKLASCMSCSAFMMANGLDASSTHLGKGESWAPYYRGESHNNSVYKETEDVEPAMILGNANHAVFMHNALSDGVAAMLASMAWVEPLHRPVLLKLDERLKLQAEPGNTVARDLYLDAMTVHKSDLVRLNDTLTIPADYIDACKRLDWFADPEKHGAAKWRNWENNFSQEQIKALHAAPDSLVEIYQLTVAGDRAGDLEYWLKDKTGEVRIQGRLKPVGDASKAVAEITLNRAVDIQTWTIKIGAENNYGDIQLDRNTSMGMGKPSYVIKMMP
jgi:hypothetical protein